MNIKEIAEGMLKENTGANFLDSCGAYGRHWQENQKVNFEELPEVTADLVDGCNIIPYVSLYHWIVSMFEIDELCEEFNSMEVKDWDGELYGVSEAGEEWLANHGFEVTGRDNSYNYDNDLSQTIILARLSLDGDEWAGYYLLQVHGGCDVRGGYTDAKLLKAYDPDYISFSGNVMALVTKKDGTRIQCDDMYNGYCITDEDGNEVIYEDGDKVEMWILEF